VTPWPDNPALHKVPDAFKDASAVFLMDSRIIEYKIEDKNIYQYDKTYRLIKVLDDKGIESFNKVYIQLNKNGQVDDIKARVITSTGKIINVPAEKIKEDVIEGRNYKLLPWKALIKDLKWNTPTV